MHTHLNSYIHTYIHTYTHIHIYTHICLQQPFMHTYVVCLIYVKGTVLYFPYCRLVLYKNPYSILLSLNYPRIYSTRDVVLTSIQCSLHLCYMLVLTHLLYCNFCDAFKGVLSHTQNTYFISPQEPFVGLNDEYLNPLLNDQLQELKNILHGVDIGSLLDVLYEFIETFIRHEYPKSTLM